MLATVLSLPPSNHSKEKSQSNQDWLFGQFEGLNRLVQRFGTANNLKNFLGNGGLAGFIVGQRQLPHQI